MPVEYALSFKEQILMNADDYQPDWWLWSSDPKPWIFLENGFEYVDLS